jgi:hypothetical protein
MLTSTPPSDASSGSSDAAKGTALMSAACRNKQRERASLQVKAPRKIAMRYEAMENSLGETGEPGP